MAKFERHRELLDLFMRIAYKASRKGKLLRVDQGLRSNTKAFLRDTTISIGDDFEKIACSLDLSKRSVY
jgi:hypothetical protein